MRKILIIVSLLLSCVSCTVTKVEYLIPELPNFELIKPIKPTLEKMTITEDVPVEIMRNTQKLINYSKELEFHVEGWERYYEELKNEYQNIRRAE